MTARRRLLAWLFDLAPRLLDSSTPRLFVFIDILALFPDFGVARVAVFAVRVPPQRSWKSRRPQNRRSALPDVLYLFFVFIYILALFPRFYTRQVEASRAGDASCRLPTCGLKMGVRRLVWHCTTQRLFVLVLCFHIHSGFVPAILEGVARR